MTHHRPTVISIQSQVVHGHVGNSAAVMALQSLGAEVAPVPTTLLSNHPRYPTMRGRMLDAGLLADLLLGVEERGLVDGGAAILTGYLGSVDNAHVVADFVERALGRNPGLVYVCDPVIGDDGAGVFVAPGVAEVIRDRLMPLATIATPNQFEVEWLSGRPARSIAALATAADAIRRAPAARLVATGCVLEDGPPGHLEAVMLGAGAPLRIPAARLPLKVHGTGDLFAGVLTGHTVAGLPLDQAARHATAALSAVLARTHAADPKAAEMILTVEDLRA